MNAAEALKSAKNGVINGRRGLGCCIIATDTGRMWHPVHAYSSLLERYSQDGYLLECIPAEDVVGECHLEWTCDELGGVYPADS